MSTKKKDLPAAKEAAVAAPKESAQPASQDARRRPLTTLRAGDCSASVWARDFVVRGKPTRFYSTTFERSYRTPGGEWKYTKSFDLADLGSLVTLCHQVTEYVRSLHATQDTYPEQDAHPQPEPRLG
jgi:hypothetical protein